MTVTFTTTLTRDEIVEVLLFVADHPSMKVVYGPLGRVEGARGPEQQVHELLAEVPRLSACWEEVRRGQQPA